LAMSRRYDRRHKRSHDQRNRQDCEKTSPFSTQTHDHFTSICFLKGGTPQQRNGACACLPSAASPRNSQTIRQGECQQSENTSIDGNPLHCLFTQQRRVSLFCLYSAYGVLRTVASSSSRFVESEVRSNQWKSARETDFLLASALIAKVERAKLETINRLICWFLVVGCLVLLLVFNSGFV